MQIAHKHSIKFICGKGFQAYLNSHPPAEKYQVAIKYKAEDLRYVFSM